MLVNCAGNNTLLFDHFGRPQSANFNFTDRNLNCTLPPFLSQKDQPQKIISQTPTLPEGLGSGLSSGNSPSFVNVIFLASVL